MPDTASCCLIVHVFIDSVYSCRIVFNILKGYCLAAITPVPVSELNKGT